MYIYAYIQFIATIENRRERKVRKKGTKKICICINARRIWYDTDVPRERFTEGKIILTEVNSIHLNFMNLRKRISLESFFFSLAPAGLFRQFGQRDPSAHGWFSFFFLSFFFFSELAKRLWSFVAICFVNPPSLSHWTHGAYGYTDTGYTWMDLGPGETERGDRQPRMSHGIFVWSKLGATISDATKRLPVYLFFFRSLTDWRLTIWRLTDGGIGMEGFSSSFFFPFFLAEFEPVLGPISFFLISISIFFLLLFSLSFGFQVAPGLVFLWFLHSL